MVSLLLALTSGSVSSRESDKSMLGIHLEKSPELSFREQHINQIILNSLLSFAAPRLPDVAPCSLSQPFAIDFVFGDFAVTARHLSLARRVKCLRGVVNYLLHENIAEADFVAARAAEARTAREWFEPDPKDSRKAEEAVQRLALLEIYQKHSPLHQLHSVDGDAIAAVSFDDFSFWLERSRKAARFSFYGPDALLEALELPVPDRMVLRPVISLASSRVPPGELFFDGERFKVPALIMLFLGHDPMERSDGKTVQRFACNQRIPFDLGDGYNAIARAWCRTSYLFGDVWLTLTLGKTESASYSDFCRQVRELSHDEDLATDVRFSPDGSKGFYVLLPPACNPPQ